MDSGPISPPRRGEILFSFNENILEGTVIARPNRFLVEVMHEGKSIPCHLHDPGRLREIIFPGNMVLFRETAGIKTSHSIVAGWNNGKWIPIDTRIHGEIAEKFLPKPFRKEVSIRGKRIDYLIGNAWVEVKGCTLNIGGVALFPDAPSRRAVEQLRVLSDLSMNGDRTCVLVLVLRDDVRCFVPNAGTDPGFASALSTAIGKGVNVQVHSVSFDGKSVYYEKRLPFCGESSIA
ncbi:MAG: DNA/RNA nuclease SfsA [Candidatus Thermoplasmatota archaeon]|jgi:sugar fermentation stimulation protein A|nr:DNA/RNA nuclease SfsA [Candidatus Thermoplasmatota archaeon]MCL5794695.1 DNA/RNA nuclease SfsA [Candidatus Thermoplasmatota archaeon]